MIRQFLSSLKGIKFEKLFVLIVGVGLCVYSELFFHFLIHRFPTTYTLFLMETVRKWPFKKNYLWLHLIFSFLSRSKAVLLNVLLLLSLYYKWGEDEKLRKVTCQVISYKIEEKVRGPTMMVGEYIADPMSIIVKLKLCSESHYR